MQSELLIIDNFYSEPYSVLEYLKTQEFYPDYGNHPGVRTKENFDPTVKNALQSALYSIAGEITSWEEMQYNTCFNVCTAEDRTWIHADCYNDWAAVVYLTPNAPIESGTGLFRHKETGLFAAPRLDNGELDHKWVNKLNEDARDWTKWEMVDYVANKFNRLVTYRGDLYHSAINYFGKDFNDARIHQTFFFNTER